MKQVFGKLLKWVYICFLSVPCTSSAEAPKPAVFGLYAVPIEAFQDVVSAGFNVVHNYKFSTQSFEDANSYVKEARPYLNAAEELGLKVILGIPRNWWLKSKNEAAIRQVIRLLKDHPALLWWYEEEAAQNGHVEKVQFLTRIVDEEDPRRGIALEEGRDIAGLRSLGETRMFTYYPVTSKARRKGRLATIQRRFPVGTLEVPFVPALQAFGRDLIEDYPGQDLLAPSWAEVQFTLYSSLISGAEGFFFYTYMHPTRYDASLKKKGLWYYTDYKPLPVIAPSLWENSKKCVVEGRQLFELLHNAVPSDRLFLEDAPKGIEAACWETAEGLLLLVANSTYRAQPVYLQGVESGQTYRRLHHNRWSPERAISSQKLEIVCPGPGGVCLRIESARQTP